MFATGLTSITFRKLTVEEIIRLVAVAGLDGIEWGGDVHVPPGNSELALQVGEATRSAGLRVLSYGSYFRCDTTCADSMDAVLATALALKAPIVRVWAGRLPSAEATPAYRLEVAVTIRSLVDRLHDAGIRVGLEYHGGTLTDTQTSAHQLLNEVGDERLTLYWQPRTGGCFEKDIVELRAALPRLSHLHVFHWGEKGSLDRKPISAGTTDWAHYLDLASQAGGDRAVMLEFVRDDAPVQFLEDAAVLKEWVARANATSA